MNISIFLAQALGLYFIIISIAMFLNPIKYKILMQEFIDNTSLRIFGGITALIIGILLVVSHNIWVASWIIVITLLAWVALIKGIINVAFPDLAKKLYNKSLESKHALTISAGVCLLIGLFLAYHGFV